MHSSDGIRFAPFPKTYGAPPEDLDTSSLPTTTPPALGHLVQRHSVSVKILGHEIELDENKLPRYTSYTIHTTVRPQ